MNNSIPAEQNWEWINPALDFTEDMAFVGVKIKPVKGKNATGGALVVTSERRIIPWDDDSLPENGILPETNNPALIEPRWSAASIQDFLNGTGPPATAEIYQSVRCYLQKYIGLRHPAEYDLVAFWIMGTYLKPLFKCYPILFFNAPYESGKSRCLEVVSQLALNGKWFGEITPSAFRRYTGSQITFCLDELKDIGLKNDSPLISILLNAYNSADTTLSGPVRGGGWLPVVFKVTSPVAIGNIQEIKNEALNSRAIAIRPEYNPAYKNIRLPHAFHSEPARIRDGLYRWLLAEWKSVRDCYGSYPDIPDLSAREMDSYSPLLAIASLAGPEEAEILVSYALAARNERNLAKKAMDDRLDFLLFLRETLAGRDQDSPLPVISNRELADTYGRKYQQRVNYRRFLGMINSLHVLSDIRMREGSKYLVFNRSEIDRQLQLMEARA